MEQFEEWRDIKNYEGLYQISNLGQVKSLPRSGTKGGLLKIQTNKKGYSFVNLCKYGKTKYFYIHRLVAEAFLSNEENLPQVDHINNDKADNQINNLQWITNVENNRKRTDGIAIPRKVICLETGEIFESLAAAGRSVNRHANSILSAIQWNRKCAGRHWNYYNEEGDE